MSITLLFALPFFPMCGSEGWLRDYSRFCSLCSHCQDQKALLGDDWDNIEIIECSEEGENSQKEICKEAGITVYPTWKFSDGEIVKGGLSLDQLEQRLGK